MNTLFLLDQENVSYLGLQGYESLSEGDKVVTFETSRAFLSPKIIKIFSSMNCDTEIQSVKVGTKNAADYQLVFLLTQSLFKNEYDNYVILSKDAGFDYSIYTLKNKYKKANIFRFTNIKEFFILDMIKKEICDGNSNISEKIYSMFIENNEKAAFENTINKTNINEEYCKRAIYFYDFIINEMNSYSEKAMEKKRQSLMFSISNMKTYEDEITNISDILGIDKKKYAYYLKLIDRFMLRSNSYNDFITKVKSCGELLNMDDFKRCLIWSKIKPYYPFFKQNMVKKR